MIKKYIAIIVLLINLLLLNACAKENNSQINAKAEIKSLNIESPIKVLTLRKDTVSIDIVFPKSFIVFANSASCKDCYKYLKDIFHTVFADLKRKPTLISIIPYIPNNVPINKQSTHLIKSLLQQDTTFYDMPIDTLDFGNTAILKEFNCKASPALLLIYRDKYIYLSNEQIFDKMHKDDLVHIISTFFEYKF